jgi:translocator protein
MTQTSPPPLSPAWTRQSLALFVLALIPPLIASVAGARLTASALVEWYPTLIKPSFTPPNLAFPIAWTTLYTLMSIAFWRILRAKPERAEAKSRAIIWFGVQIVANIAWSYAFFYSRSPMAGLIVVGLLFLSIAGMMRAFYAVDRIAAYSQIPYLCWVGFASVLNATIVVLNLS